MSVTLSIKNVPERLAQNLRLRASHHHRSLQGELMVILEEAACVSSTPAPIKILAKIQQLGLETSAESVNLIRSDRDAH